MLGKCYKYEHNAHNTMEWVLFDAYFVNEATETQIIWVTWLKTNTWLENCESGKGTQAWVCALITQEYIMQ